MNKIPGNIVPSFEVQKALEEGLPIVALESTVLTHGLPYPQNLEVFHTLEEILHGEKVTPATIIVLDGVAHIGLDEGTVEMLESRLRAGYRFEKLGMRDLGLASAKSVSGGTTVSATMKLASLSGIDLRHWRNRRRAQGLGTNPGYLQRPQRSGNSTCRSGFRGLQGDPGRPRHAGIPGNPGGACVGLAN